MTASPRVKPFEADRDAIAGLETVNTGYMVDDVPVVREQTDLSDVA